MSFSLIPFSDVPGYWKYDRIPDPRAAECDPSKIYTIRTLPFVEETILGSHLVPDDTFLPNVGFTIIDLLVNEEGLFLSTEDCSTLILKEECY